MALITCDECGKQCSSQSRKCVFCGYQTNQSFLAQDLGFDGYFFKVFALVGFVLVFTGYPLGWAFVAFGILCLLIRSMR